MATVRMSRSVIEKIQENASKAFLKSDPFKTFSNDLADKIYSFYYEPIITIWEEFKKHPQVNIGRSSKEAEIHLSLEGIEINKYVNHTQEQTFGENAYRRNWYSCVNVPLSSPKTFYDEGSNSSQIKLPSSSEFYTEVLDILEYNNDVFERTKDNHTKIGSVVEACVTVNQFIKAWPAGAVHVPEEALQKANQRSVQKQAAEQRRALVEGMETDLNTSILTSSLLD